MPNLTAGKGLGFKVGTQNSVNTIITAGSGAIPGSFYLAEDTHRLYIGNDDGSLSAVNEGVITVAAVANLPTLTAGANQAYQGQFYYCTSENILCVCSGDRWVQINPDTYLKHNVADTSISGVTSNGVTTATIAHEIKDQGGTVQHTSSGDFSIRGSANIGVEVDSTNRIITLTSPNGATYTLSGVTRNAQDSVDLILDGSDGSSSTITLKKGSGGVYPTLVTDSTDGHDIIMLDGGGMTGAAAVTLTENNGVLTLSVKDSGGTQKSVSLTPKIKIGNTEQTVLFDLDSNNNLVADLNVYTIQEVNDLIASNMKTFDAMYFAGTIGTGGTAATDLTVLKSLGTVRSGATFKFIESINSVPNGMTIEGWKSTGANSGDMLIVTGTEDANGYLDLSDSTNTKFTFVPSADDTTEVYVPNFETQKSLRFVSTAALGATHTATFEPLADSQITISGAVTSGANGSKTQTITIGHAPITTTKTTADDVSTSTRNTTDYTAITGLTFTNGHVSGYETTKITISQNKLKTVATTASVDSSTNDTTGITTSSMLFGQQYTDTCNNNLVPASNANNKFGLTSDTLTFALAAAGAATGSSNTASSVKIDMVWGSF